MTSRWASFCYSFFVAYCLYSLHPDGEAGGRDQPSCNWDSWMQERARSPVSRAARRAARVCISGSSALGVCCYLVFFLQINMIPWSVPWFHFPRSLGCHFPMFSYFIRFNNLFKKENHEEQEKRKSKRKTNQPRTQPDSSLFFPTCLY